MIRALVLFAMLASCAPRVAPPTPRPEPAPHEVDEALMDLPPLPELPRDRLPRTFTPLRYAAALDIDPDREEFRGRIAITGTLAEATSVVWLHAEELLIERVTVARPGVAPRRIAGRQPSRTLAALHSKTPLAAGEWTFTIDYTGRWRDNTAEGGFRQRVPNATTTGRPYIFTQFEADYARMVFPCVDEPDRKTPWQLTITAPKDLMVASNTPAASTTTTATSQTVTFAPTSPLPSYLVAFAVGPFEIVDGGRTKAGIPVRILTLHTMRDRTAHGAKVTAGIVDRIESWLGVPFPYPKLDVVVVPWTTDWWLAMENPGLVTIGSSVLHDNATWDHVMAHEIAHHWFGDLVTLAWWDDLWLNEAFAEWVAVITTTGEQPSTEMVHRTGAIRSAVTTLYRPFGTRAARDNGPPLLSRFATLVGMDTMRAAIKRYLESHAHGTVTTTDFARALDDAVGEPVSPLLVSYLESPPVYVGTELDCSAKQPRVKVTTNATSDQIVCVAYDADGTRAETCRRTTHPDRSFALDAKKCPRWFLGENLDAASIVKLLDTGWPHLRRTEQERIFELANRASPELALAVIARSTTWVESPLRPLYVAMLVETRAQLDDAALRKRFDAWLLRDFGARMKGQELTATWDLPMLGVLGGEPTFVEQARTLAASGRPGAGVAHRLLAHTDASYASELLANLWKVDGVTLSRYRYALEGSPFVVELLEANAKKLTITGDILYLLRWTCNRTHAQVVDLAKALSPGTSDSEIGKITNPSHHAACVSKHKAAADAVRAMLDAKDRERRPAR